LDAAAGFFFSGRRRHTRSKRDWSSDVCSSDLTIVVQAREVSADGKMIDDMMISMSQEISGGKMADAVLEIENYDGDLPEIEEDIEMILHIFSWDDHDFEGDVDVKIEFE